MPNPIKYKSGNLTGSIQKGNVALAINDVVGPTSTTGWYNGPNFTQGTYQIIETAATGDPDVFCPQNDAELIKFAKWKGATGNNTSSAAAVLAWIGTQSNLLVINEIYPNIVTSGSVLMLDAGFVGSYPTTASNWYDISGNTNNGTLTNGPTFNSLGVINFDNVDDYVQISSSLDLNALAATRNMTVCFTAKKLFYGTGGNNTGDSMILIGADNGYNTGFRITEINTGTPGTPFTGSPHYNFGAPALGNGFAALSPRAINTNTFSYVCFAQSGSSITSFINGKFATGTLPNAYTPGANRGSIGRDIGAGVGWFGGYIGNFQIYNRALSQAEILQNYYQAPIVTDGLVFSIDAGNLASYENGSALTYSLTGSISGSLVNGVGYSNMNGGTWVMDGADDFMRVSQLSGSNFPQASGTISFWYYISSIGGNTDFSDKAIFDGYDTSGRNHFFIRNYYVSPDNIQIVGQLSGSGGAYCFAYSTYLPNDQWHNVVLAYTTGSNSSYQIYMDGILKNTGTLGSNPSTFAPNGQYCGFGSGYLGGGAYACMQGKYSSLFIYNRALSATEVAQNFNAQKSRFGL